MTTAYPHQLERFIRGYLTGHTAEVVQPAYGILEAVLAGQLSRQLGADYLKLAFDYEAVQEHPDAQYVTYGSKFLDNLVALAVENHSSAIRYCLGQGRQPAYLEDRAASYLKASAGNIKIVEPPKAYFAPCLRFKFKLAYLSDEREEELQHIWLDGYRGCLIKQYAALAHIYYAETAEDLRPELPARPLIKLLPAALEALESAAGIRRVQLEAESTRHLKSDLERTEAYFASMIEDLQLKLSKAGGDDKQEKQIAGKLDILAVQKQHHIKDINEKYRVKCEATLLDAVLYMVPRWRIIVQVSDIRQRAAGQESTLWWDEILKCLID